MTGCVSTRSVTAESSEFRVESLESVEKVDSVIVTVFDTITITKTITIRESETGDTLRMTTVTDRERIRSMSDVRSKKADVVVKTDTVYVERDSVAVRNTNCTNPTNGSKSSRGSIVQGLKWVFWILVAVIVLILLIRLLPKR